MEGIAVLNSFCMFGHDGRGSHRVTIKEQVEYSLTFYNRAELLLFSD